MTAPFALRFILFSTYGGYFADRFSERSVTIAVKLFEFVVVAIACIGLTSQDRTILIAGILLTGVLAAFFGPSRYGILRELLPESKLSWHNEVPEFGTYSQLAFIRWNLFASAVCDFQTEILGLSPPAIFIFCDVFKFAGTVTSLILSPDSLVRAFLWIATHSVYRVRVEGLEMPRRGGALLINNHVSFLDRPC